MVGKKRGGGGEGAEGIWLGGEVNFSVITLTLFLVGCLGPATS